MMFRWDINGTQERPAAVLNSLRNVLCYAFLHENRQKKKKKKFHTKNGKVKLKAYKPSTLQ